MGIFQKSVIQKYLSNLDKEHVEKAFQQFRESYSPAKIEKIKLLKEEEYQDGFLRDLFVNVLGYTLKPDDNYNLAREFKNQGDGKKADGAILKNEKAIAVIELKSTKTKDLKSITEQAFNYKNNQPDCKYVITSNFQKLRFYIDYANEFEEFDLFHLQRPDFELLYLFLNKNSVFSDLPLKLKEETRFHEQNISNKLYNDYSVFKNRLFENLIKNNPENDKLTLFKKSQKLLDRFLFILFAEDSGLLPPNSISRIVKRFEVLKEEDAYKPIYNIYKQYFGYMNIGRKGKTTADDIPAYNGGLFYTDELLDNLKIDDEILIDDLLKLSEYDFSTEVDVNILGHIFEHSLSEIEEITAEIEGTTTDKTKNKRKKDGIFYTPKYITQYIVENTIGTLCNEKRKELGIEEIEFDGTYRTKDGNLSVKGKKLFQKLNDYKDWLLSLKIVDPACGSGAFLNQALNFLIQEHKNIDDIIAELTNTALRLFDTEKSILENNLFGVDINEESVEIAKLSLWLRTAHKDRKLSNLNNNIKCGNSLIDDPEVAGDKAFDWQKEFPEIMKNGGFDVVIGNPPYVKARDNEDIRGRRYIENKFRSPYKMWDLYVPFVEKGINILKPNGLSAMIIPDTIGKSEYTNKLIEIIETENYLYQIDFFPDIYVFENVGVRSKILFVQKSKSNLLAKRVKHYPTIHDVLVLNSAKEKGNEQYLLNVSGFNINRENCITLADICYVSYGMRLNSDKTDPKKFKKIDLLSEIKDEIHNKLYTEGKYLERYSINKSQFLEYGTERCPNRLVRPTFPELYTTDKLLLSRQKKVGAISYENHYCDNTIIMAIPAFNLSMVDNKSIRKYYKNISKNRLDVEANSKKFDLHYLLGIINSKLIKYYIVFASKGKIDFYPDDWKNIPIGNYSNINQQQLILKVKTILNFTSNSNDLTQKFIKYLQLQVPNIELSRNLKNWHKLEFADFIKELNKTIKKAGGEKLSKKDEIEWMELFEEKKAEIQIVKAEIEKTDKEIDQLVYELYGLTKEEIAIIENSTN